MPKAKGKAPAITDKDYEQLGRMLVTIYETGYRSHKKVYAMNFTKGVLAGIGGIIGATVAVALLLWVLTLFSDVPLIGRFTEQVRGTIEQGQNR